LAEEIFAQNLALCNKKKRGGGI